MKLIKPSFEIIDQNPGFDGMLKHIELCGRVCHKSEDKITPDSAKKFVERMIKSGHGAMLEHGTVYLKLTPSQIHIYHKYRGNPYTKTNKVNSKAPYPVPTYYISTNYRVLIEQGWLDDLKYICEPTEYHEKRVTVRFILSRSIAQEYTRHRVFSFAMESQRYCNYSKSKFNNEVTFIIPCWLDIPSGSYTNLSQQSPEDGEYKQIMLHENNINAYPVTTTPAGRFLWELLWSERGYFDLLNQGWKPQQAREVLPNACKTELVMTGFVSDWKHFFSCRSHIASTGKPHPQAQELADPLMSEFIKRGYIKEEV